MGASLIPLRIILDGEGAFTELQPKVTAGQVEQGQVAAVAALPRGMNSGKPSVMAQVDLPDGRVVMAETSMRLFLMASRAFRIRYGNVDEQD